MSTKNATCAKDAIRPLKSLVIVEATLCEALEYWLNETQLKKPCTVTSFKSQQTSYRVTFKSRAI